MSSFCYTAKTIQHDYGKIDMASTQMAALLKNKDINLLNRSMNKKAFV